MGTPVKEIGEPLRPAIGTAPRACKGPSCPFFDACQGRCTLRNLTPPAAPDGGIVLPSR